MNEEIKDAIRRRTVDRTQAKACINFLGQPMGRALHVKLKSAHESWKASADDATLVEEVTALSQHYGKQQGRDTPVKRLCREDLELICSSTSRAEGSEWNPERAAGGTSQSNPGRNP